METKYCEAHDVALLKHKNGFYCPICNEVFEEFYGSPDINIFRKTTQKICYGDYQFADTPRTERIIGKSPLAFSGLSRKTR
jgi:hypothetical protein